MISFNITPTQINDLLKGSRGMFGWRVWEEGNKLRLCQCYRVSCTTFSLTMI